MKNEPNGALPQIDPPSLGIGMALTAMLISLAMDLGFPERHRTAFIWLMLACLMCFLAVARPWPERLYLPSKRLLLALLSVSVVVQAISIFHVSGEFAQKLTRQYYIGFLVAIGLLTFLVVIQVENLRGLRKPMLILLLICFAVTAGMEFKQGVPDPTIDVFMFQKDSSTKILQGVNPYDAQKMRFKNVYKPDTPFYGPGVIDTTGHLSYGFPYPPLSLLMVIPAQVIAGDVRFANLAAILLSAALMIWACPVPQGVLAAGILLLSLRIFFVLEYDWTEPLLLFSFSTVMFCACRWRKGLPWALGLFFATKQYTVLALPAVWLLTTDASSWKQLFRLYLKAGLVVVATVLPFFLWNPHQFIRAVVQWQLVQPFRYDGLSFLVIIFPKNLHRLPPVWLPFLPIIPTTVLALWRLARTPSGFAAMVTIVDLVFFAFNKQSFCNYYFFVLGTTCWSVAAFIPSIGSPRHMHSPENLLELEIRPAAS